MLQQNTAMIRTDADYSRVLFFSVFRPKTNVFWSLMGLRPTPLFFFENNKRGNKNESTYIR